MKGYRYREPWKTYDDDGAVTYAILLPGDIVRWNMVWEPA